MISAQKRFWASVATFIASTVGVGIFGLPKVFATMGWPLGLVYLLLVALLNVFVLTMYADVITHTAEHKRLAGLAGRYLGDGWRPVAAAIIYMQAWGAMLSYIVIGGEFIHALIQPWFNISVNGGRLIFGIFAAVILFGGLGLVAWFDSYFILAILALLAVLAFSAYGIGHFDFILHVSSGALPWFLPFGPLLFALSVSAAMPEIAQILAAEKYKLRRVVFVGSAAVVLLYAAFTALSLSIAGPRISEEALISLGQIIGPWFLLGGTVFGLFSVFTSFIIMGMSIIDSLVYDWKQRYLPSWLLTVAIPFIALALGVNDFIKIISWTGGITVSATSLIIILIYRRAQKDSMIPKRSLSFSPLLSALAAGLYFVALVATLI